MPLRRPQRLRDFDYKGKVAYSVTICAYHRLRAFEDTGFAREAQEKLLRTAERFGFALIAYCLMPDHVHLLPFGRREDSDLRAFVRSWNTQTGFAWRQRHRGQLWQPGYYERIIRSDANLYLAARYIVMNPVRAGLVEIAAQYEFSGSTRYTMEDLLDDGFSPPDKPKGLSPQEPEFDKPEGLSPQRPRHR